MLQSRGRCTDWLFISCSNLMLTIYGNHSVCRFVLTLAVFVLLENSDKPHIGDDFVIECLFKALRGVAFDFVNRFHKSDDFLFRIV